MVAYGGAGGVPIAVPFNCLNVMSPKQNMLFNNTSFRAAISASFCLGHSSLTDLRICLGMLVYIHTASAVKSLAFVGYVVEHSC